MEAESCFGALGGLCSPPSTLRANWGEGIRVLALYPACICGKGLLAERCSLIWIWVTPMWI